MPSDIIVGKLTDRVIIELFEALKKDFGLGSTSYQVGEIGAPTLPEELISESTHTFAINYANYNAIGNSFTVNISRNHNNSPYFDLIRLVPNSNGNPNPTADMMFKADRLIRSIAKTPDMAPESLTESGFAGIFESEISRISALHHKMLEDATTLRAKIDQEEIERKARFDTEQDEIRQKLRKDEEESLAKIAAQKAELQEKLSEFDISDHMRARRKQREQITEEIGTAIARPVSSGSSRLSFSLLVGFCFLASLGSGLMAYETIESFRTQSNSSSLTSAIADYATQTVASPTNEQNTSNSAQSSSSREEAIKDALIRAAAKQASGGGTYLLWMLAIRGALLSIVAVGFAAYLINLLRNNFDQEIRYLRELQRYGMDINRASWIVETAMEMQTKENAKLPDQWVEGACAGLFQFGKKDPEEVSSLAALGALMKLGPEVEVGANGARVSVGKSGTKAAAKDA